MSLTRAFGLRLVPAGFLQGHLERQEYKQLCHPRGWGRPGGGAGGLGLVETMLLEGKKPRAGALRVTRM